MLFFVGKFNAPQTHLHPNLSTYEYVTLHGERDFADVTKGEDPAMGRYYPRLSRDQSIHLGP